MKIDPNCRYTETHDWLRVEGDEGIVGITDYAQNELSDIVYVELPEAGDSFDKGQVYAIVESVKAAADCYLAVGGEVLAVGLAAYPRRGAAHAPRRGPDPGDGPGAG